MSFWYLANHLGRRFLREAARLLGEVAPLGAGLWRSEVLGRLVFLVSSIDLAVRRMASLHSSAWKEIEAMVRRTSKGLTIDLRPAIESLGLGQVIEQVGTKRVIEEIGSKRFIEEIGSKRFIEEIGSKRLFEEIDLEDLLANLSPAKRRELKRRLQ
jgi:hypothetical protein